MRYHTTANYTTQSAISDDILTLDGKEIETKTINTNTENTLHQLGKIFDKKKIEERQELARLFSKNVFEEVHRLSEKFPWKDGSQALNLDNFNYNQVYIIESTYTVGKYSGLTIGVVEDKFGGIIIHKNH